MSGSRKSSPTVTADDEDEFFDALSHATLSRQSSLSSIPSPTRGSKAAVSEIDHGPFRKAFRPQNGVRYMSAQLEQQPVHVEAAQATEVPPDVEAVESQPEISDPLELPDDPSIDPLESNFVLDLARLDQGASDGGTGTVLATPSEPDPLSSPLLQVSRDPSGDLERATQDPFAMTSPEPVLLGKPDQAWLSTGLAGSQLANASPDAEQADVPDGRVAPSEPLIRQRSNGAEVRISGQLSASRTGSETLHDIQADHSGGLFGGLEMEEVDDPPSQYRETEGHESAGGVSGPGTSKPTEGDGENKSTIPSDKQEPQPVTSSRGSDSPVRASDAEEDTVQALPISKPASTGRNLGSLSASEAVTRESSEGTNGMEEGSGEATSRRVPSAQPSKGIQNGSSAPRLASQDNAGAALQDFAAMLSRKKRHYFMVSNGGIPIYSRHGRPHDTASVAALLYSIVSLSLDALGEIPHTFTAGELTVSVRARRVRADPYATQQRGAQHPRHPYNLAPAAHRTLGNVAVLTASATRSDLPPAVLQVHLELLHLQLLAWTSGKYERVLMDNPSLDTSAALAGTEASFEALVKRMDIEMDYVLQAVETLRMRPIVRGAAEAALQQVVAVVPHPQLPQAQHLHAWDLLLLLNLVTANESYRVQLAGQQAWVPLCLPKSAPDCFHFVYVHYPSSSSPLFIALIGRSQQKFFETHNVREPLMATLDSTGVLEEAKVASAAASSHRVPPAAIPFQDRLRHLQPLLYHMTVAKRNFFVQTAFAPAISSHRLQKQAKQDCMRLHASMWGAAAVSKTHDPMPIQWRACRRWALLGVIERGEYEAYAVMDPLIHKTEAMALFNHALAYLLENPENWQASTDAKGSEGSSFWSAASADGTWSRAVLRS